MCAHNKVSNQSFNATIYRLKTNLAFGRQQYMVQNISFSFRKIQHSRQLLKNKSPVRISIVVPSSSEFSSVIIGIPICRVTVSFATCISPADRFLGKTVRFSFLVFFFFASTSHVQQLTGCSLAAVLTF